MDPTQWNAPYVVVAGALFVIVFARANGTYWLGRALAAGSRRTKLAGFLNSPGYMRAEKWIDTWGAPAVALCFLTIGVQTMVNLAAGAGRMRQRHYLPAVTTGCIIWAIIYATVGFVGFAALGKLWAMSPAWTLAAVGLVALVVVATLVARSRQSRKTFTGVSSDQ